MKKNKAILILGAKSDIAIATAYKFASEGFNIQLAARSSSDLDTLSKDINIKYSVSCHCHELDILNTENIDSFIDSLEVMPEIVFSAVGLMGNQKEDESSVDNASLVLRTNFEGPMLLLNEMANLFEKRGSGTIIGISSVAGERGRASNYIYGSAKAGFSAFLSGLRNRLNKSNIAVITVLPGYVYTKMTEDIELPGLLTIKPQKLAKKIYHAYKKKRDIVYSGYRWNVIMLIVKLIPEKIFKRLSI